MPSDAVIKSVSKKLTYYFQVKRLEDGFDLSGPDCPRLDHPPIKARPTLMYDGLHDRPLKHYFSPPEVKTALTQFKVPEDYTEEEVNTKKRVKKYINRYDFRASTLPDTYYRRHKNGARSVRPETMGYGVPLRKAKGRPTGSYPVLRSTPNAVMTRGEANRLVNTATRLIVGTETIRFISEEERKADRQSCPYMKQQSDSLPALSAASTKTKSPRSPRMPEYDLNGRRIPSPKRPSEDETDNGYGSRPSSGHDGYLTISGKPADDKKVKPWLKKEMRASKVQAKDGAQRPNSAFVPKAESQRPPSGDRRPNSAFVKRPASGKKKKHRPADPSTLPSEVQPKAWDLEVCSTCAEEMRAENPPPEPREATAVQTSGELLRNYDPMEKVIWDGEMCRYRIHVHTGSRLGASTKADIKLVLCGDKGRTEEIWLRKSKTHKIMFQKGQEDVFDLEHFFVGKLRKISIGHDRTELGYGWYLDRVVVKDMVRLVRYEIPCARWLSAKEGDGLTVREFNVTLDTFFQEVESDPEVETGEQMRKASPPPVQHSAPPQTHEETASHTSLDMHRSRENSTSDGSERRSRDRHSSGQSSSYSTESSLYSTSTASTPSPSSRSDASPTPIATTQQPTIYVPQRKARDDFFDQTTSEKDYSSVIESLAERDRRPVESATEPQSKPQRSGGEMSLKPVSAHAGPTAEYSRKQPKIYEDSDSDTGRISIGDQSERSDPQQHQFLDGFKAGLEAAKKTEDGKKRKSSRSSDSDSDDQVMDAGPSVHEAAKAGDLERIKRLAKHNPALKTLQDERGWTPLHLSAKAGQLEVVQWLSVNLTDLDVLTPTGYTAIHIAAMNGKTDCIKVLSAMGAQLDCKNTEGQRPLHLAVMSGHLDTVKWLVANDADIRALNANGETALDRARVYEHTDVVEYLEACARELENPESQFAMTHSNRSTSSRPSSGSSMSSSGSRTTASSSTSSASSATDRARVHAHAHSFVADTGRPKTSRGSRGARGDGANDGYSSDKEPKADAELMTEPAAADGPSLLDSIRAEYERS